MGFDQGFSLANSVALACWAVVILAPRRRWLNDLLRFGVLTGFAIVYTALIIVCFARVQGGGFNSIAQVRALFGSDGTLLAGWIHYLAWDLFVGLWIAERADASCVSRWIQGPILFATFMFGPVGYLLFVSIDFATRWGPVAVAAPRLEPEV